MDPYVGQIFMFGGNFAPRGYAYCDGQILAISQFEALFALLGTVYGGDGRTSFGLPNLKGRMPLGTGNGAGLQPVIRGQTGGAFRTSLTTAQMPTHTHQASLDVDPDPGRSFTPIADGYINASPPAGFESAVFYSAASPHIANPIAQSEDCTPLSEEGSSFQFTHYPPLIAINYIIVTAGIFPSQN